VTELIDQVLNRGIIESSDNYERDDRFNACSICDQVRASGHDHLSQPALWPGKE
jgi:hypothetical protein